MFTPDQQVEIAAGPERGMGVERFGEDEALERDHGDVPAPEGFEEPPELAAQGEMAGRALDEMMLQPLADGGRQAFRRCALPGKAERGRERLAFGRLDDSIPVERITGNGRLVAGAGAETNEEAAGLRPPRVRSPQRASREPPPTHEDL